MQDLLREIQRELHHARLTFHLVRIDWFTRCEPESSFRNGQHETSIIDEEDQGRRPHCVDRPYPKPMHDAAPG